MSNNNNTPNTQIYVKMIKMGNTKMLQKEIKKNKKLLEIVDDKGSSLLHSASQEGNVEMVKMLLECGANINAIDKEKYTPVLEAASQKHFNVVKLLLAAKSKNILYDKSGRFAIVGGLEKVLIWNIKTGELISTLEDKEIEHEVTTLALSPDGQHLAVGYFDGSIRIWSAFGRERVCKAHFQGHKREISTLAYNKDGTLLASGSSDTEIVIWDAMSETGLYRLIGHKDRITNVKFLVGNRLVTSSKDTLIKVWDLETQSCSQTLVGHKNEVWHFDINDEETRLVSGSRDDKLRVWKIPPLDVNSNDKHVDFVYYGQVSRKSGMSRVLTLKFSDTQTGILVCQSSREIEVFQLNDQETQTKRFKRRNKRSKEKFQKNNGSLEGFVPEESSPQDEYTSLYFFKTKVKFIGISISPINESEDNKKIKKQILVSLNNNKIQVFRLRTSKCSKISSLSKGHDSDVRVVALSDDDSLFLSASSSTVRVWNESTKQCVSSVKCGYALSALFLPGDNFFILGTKSGDLEIFDVGSSLLSEKIKAHSGSIWSICLLPDNKGILTGGADKSIKFWNYVFKKNEDGKDIFTLELAQTIEMSDDVLCVKFSPNGKFIAVALLDSTVKIFFADTLNFFLSLYGHKLPVLTIDISSDNTLIAPGSADKKLKIWGMDFGDCHKSVWAHDDSVTKVKFIPDTHLLFTSGKDGAIKMWDIDTYERITTMKCHYSEVRSIDISKNGNFLVSGSHDRSIRIWERGGEQIFINEEREREMEKEYDSELRDDNKLVIDPNEKNKIESGRSQKNNSKTLKAVDRVIEALEICQEELKNQKEYELALENYKKMGPKDEIQQKIKNGEPLLEPPTPSPLLLRMTPSQYLLSLFMRLPNSDREDLMYMLPYSYVVILFDYFSKWISDNAEIEFCCRSVFLLVNLHFNQITANRDLFDHLFQLTTRTKECLKNFKGVVGFNFAATNSFKRQIESSSNTFFFHEKIRSNVIKSKKKRKFETDIMHSNIDP
eukprot:TRINITY_DN1080_c0_g4_i1.p1 TRINITY_DN1080_c0_g4~~TRINITY_DN1080_c0_g4_i1.p1  ORF type:complete len:1003 (-),score=321.23 TRINITY_DN1080_c0_g4_i1:121-3129(-)